MIKNFWIEFETANDSFKNKSEVSRIVREIADKFDHGQRYGPVIDVNGNTVGNWGLEDEEDEEN